MQQTGRVRRRWGATVVGSLAAVALAAGCTGDEGVQVVTEGADSAAALTAAVDATPTSGRFVATMRMEMPDMAWTDDEPVDDEVTDETVSGEPGFEMPSTMETSVEGEFSGDDVRAVVSGDFGFGDFRSESMQVGDRIFTSADTMTQMFDAFETGDESMDSMLSGQRSSLEEAIGGKQWIASAAPEVDDEMYDTSGLGGLLYGGGSLNAVVDPTVVLEDVAEVRELDPVDDAGERLRRFAGVAAVDELFGPGAMEPEDTSPEATARVERIEAYAASRSTSSVEVLVGPDGFVRRIQLELTDDVEDQYRDCIFLTNGGSMSMTIELSDLGAPIEIAAPDPATVIEQSELDETGGMFGLDDEGGLSDDYSETELFGREYADEMLVEGASIIGLDPATIPSMTDEQVDDSLAQVEEVAATLPTFDTPLGPQNRLEMLSSIRVGTDMLGIEPLDLSAQTDQQLADLITKFIEEEGMDFGLTDDAGLDDPDYDEFEGCPA